MSQFKILIRFVFIAALLAGGKVAAQSQLEPLVVEANKGVDAEEADQSPEKESSSEASEDSEDAPDPKEAARKA